MSRTYRKTVKGRKACHEKQLYKGDPKIRCGRWHDWMSYDYPNEDYFNWMTTPHWWNHDMMEIPFRQHNRRILRNIITNKIDIEDADLIFRETHKKPHNYYW